MTIASSCNDGQVSEEKSDSTSLADEALKFNLEAFNSLCDSPGIGNFAVSKDTANAMFNRFRSIYTANPGAENFITDSFWIDACVIKAVGKYLDSAKDLSGLRFVFAAAKKQPPARLKNETKLFLVVTKDTIRGGVTKTRDEKWDLVIPGTSCGASKDYFSNYKKAQALLQHYDKEFRQLPATGGKPQRDSLSKSVWFQRCVIVAIGNFMAGNENVDGINIKLGAYSHINAKKHPGQSYMNQSTVVIVPTSNQKDDWSIVAEIRRMFPQKFNDEGLNHGSLCPNDCQ